MNSWISAIAISGMTLWGCVPPEERSHLKILGGIETDENKAVVFVRSERSGCTGTFVAKNAILTAAHCLGMKYKGKTPARDIPHPRYPKGGSSATGDARYDLRILTFGESLSETYVNISSTAPSHGDTARAIGFGCNAFDPDDEEATRGAGTKRAGNIKIDLIQAGYLAAIDSDVDTCPGDSGGPLLSEQGELVGVASRITWSSGNINSFWADLTSEENRRFISQTLSTADSPSQGGDNQNNDNPSDNQSSDSSQNTPPSNSAEVDCVRDYSLIRAGGTGICINRTSGFCYRFDSGDVLYDLGRVACSGAPGGSGNPPNNSSPGNSGGSSQQQPSQPSEILDCNRDYLRIINSTNSGICLNRSSGLCYKYSNGDIRYNEGRVTCPSR
jgi:hypothetical protein